MISIFSFLEQYEMHGAGWPLAVHLHDVLDQTCWSRKAGLTMGTILQVINIPNTLEECPSCCEAARGIC